MLKRKDAEPAPKPVPASAPIPANRPAIHNEDVIAVVDALRYIQDQLGCSLPDALEVYGCYADDREISLAREEIAARDREMATRARRRGGHDPFGR